MDDTTNTEEDVVVEDISPSTLKDLKAFADIPFQRRFVEDFLGLNANSMQLLMKKGVINNAHVSNRDVVRAIFKYYQDRRHGLDDVKKVGKGLVDQKIISDIQLNKAKIELAMLDVLEKRKVLVSYNELYRLMGEIFSIIASELTFLSMEQPIVQPYLDKSFDRLSKLGEKILQQARIDEEIYIDNKMDDRRIMELLEQDLKDE